MHFTFNTTGMWTQKSSGAIKINRVRCSMHKNEHGRACLNRVEHLHLLFSKVQSERAVSCKSNGTVERRPTTAARWQRRMSPDSADLSVLHMRCRFYHSGRLGQFAIRTLWKVNRMYIVRLVALHTKTAQPALGEKRCTDNILMEEGMGRARSEHSVRCIDYGEASPFPICLNIL